MGQLFWKSQYIAEMLLISINKIGANLSIKRKIVFHPVNFSNNTNRLMNLQHFFKGRVYDLKVEPITYIR